MKLCLIAIFSLVLMACAGSSPRIDPARLGELQKGRTTVDEVVRQFGRPSLILRNPDGTQLVRYLHSAGQSGTTMVPLVATTAVDSVNFYFDTSGVLTDYKTAQAKTDTPASASASAPAPAPADPATRPDGPAPANTSKTTAAGSGNTKQPGTSSNEAPQGNRRTWSFPSSLIPSTTKENR